MNTIVSIILPTYNGANRIKRAIESVIAQSYTSWELLVIDDGSTDNTAEVVREFSLRDFRVRYIKNETNLGIQRSLNRGIAESCGINIARIDDDDQWIDCEKLSTQVSFLNQHDDHVLVGTGLVAVDENGNELFSHIPPQSDGEIRKVILNKNCFTHSSVMFLKESVVACGGYSESAEVRHIEDYELWLKLGTVGKFANIPICSVKLVIRHEGLSSVHKISQFTKSIKLIKSYKNKYPRYLWALLGLSCRMALYWVLQKRIFRSLYARLYKVYRNL